MKLIRSLRTTLAASGLRVKWKASVKLRLRGKVRLDMVGRGQESVVGGGRRVQTMTRARSEGPGFPPGLFRRRLNHVRVAQPPTLRGLVGHGYSNLSRLSTAIHPPFLGLAPTSFLILRHSGSDYYRQLLVTTRSRELLDSYDNSTTRRSEPTQPKSCLSQQAAHRAAISACAPATSPQPATPSLGELGQCTLEALPWC